MTKEIKGSTASTVFAIIMIFAFIFMVGYMVGYSQRGKDQNKWDCEFKYGNVEFKNISGDCLKYFKVGK